MEAPKPTLTVEIGQPALIRRPGPVLGSCGGVFQPFLSGKYASNKNITGSDDTTSNSSGESIDSLAQQAQQAFTTGHFYPGRTTLSTMEASMPTHTVQTLLPALNRRPGPVLGTGRGVFQPVLSGKYTMCKNFICSDDVPSNSFCDDSDRFIQSSGFNRPVQTVAINESDSHPGRTTLGTMEAPKPPITVQTFQPAFLSRPGPVLGVREGSNVHY